MPGGLMTLAFEHELCGLLKALPECSLVYRPTPLFSKLPRKQPMFGSEKALG
jgi:hypothetical protein